jgi:PAP2 superfamily/Domain of unknown function (DUF4114)/Bacterial Ig-like domain
MDILNTQQNPQPLFSSDIFSGLTDKNSIDVVSGDRGLAQLPTFIDPILANNLALVDTAKPIDLPVTDVNPLTYSLDDLARQSGYNYRANPATTETLQTIERALSFRAPEAESIDTAGIYTVDESGKVAIDFLADGGTYRNQMGLFSLTGMENLAAGSAAFIKEAARRALSGTDGYIAVNQTTDAGKFQLEAGHDNGKYSGRQTFSFKPGDRIAMMMVPDGSIQEVFNAPTIDGSKRPLFSIAAANPGAFQQIGELADGVYGWEDIRRDKTSDADYNDLLFQVIGASGNSTKLSTLIAPQWKWQETKACQDMVSYAGVQATANDKKSPLLSIALVEDSGSSKTDKITYNPNLSITATDDRRIATLTAKLQGNNPAVDISSKLKPDGTLTLNLGDLESYRSSLLADGNYTVSLSATDVSGNQSSNSLTFTLDTTAPTKPTIALLAATDSGNIGDDRTNFATVTLTGKADANTQLQIVGTPAGSNPTPVTKTVTTDAAGNYQLTGFDLSFGINQFDVSATDIAGNTVTTTRSIRQIAKDDVIITWNQVLLNAIATAKTAPPVATRAMAIMETAVFDAVNNIAKKYKNYAITDAAPVQATAAEREIECEAAAVQAAYTVLTSLFASQKVTFDAALATSLAAIQDGKAKTDGIAFGLNIGTKALAARVGDGSAAVVAAPTTNNPGDWVPTAVVTNANGTTSPAPAVLPQWGTVKTFGILQADVAANRPAAPPALTSQQYATELNQVKDLGSATSTTRTADQTEIAKFWADGGGTFTPPGHWNQIAQDVARDRNNSLVDNARLFAALNVAEADAAICCWDAKYTFDRWRPITAIRNADKDGNDQTTVDAAWTPLLTTPNFPAYTSGHSTFSCAAATVLTSFFGDNYKFSTTSPGLAGVTRNFTSFDRAADEAGMSRIYGGIHFMSDNTAGLAAGKVVGTYIANNLFSLV